MRGKPYLAALFIFGLLTAISPRYVLPVCGFAGFEHMVCDRLYYAGLVFGSITAAVSIAGFFAPSAFRTLMIISFIIGIMIVFSPDILGYCNSPAMPCRYGTLPMARILGIMITGVAASGFAFAPGRGKKEARYD